MTLLPLLPVWQWLIFVLLGLLLYKYMKGGTPLPLPLPEFSPKWFTGNAFDSKVSFVDNNRIFYDAMKHHRMSIYWDFGRPCIFITDLELIKAVQVTDFEYFINTGFTTPDYLQALGLQFGLVDSRDENWRTLKKLITPTFSGPRIKKLSGGINRASKLLVEYLKEQEKSEHELDILEALQKFAMTCLADVAFGTDVNCFKDPDNSFLKHGKSLMDTWRFFVMISCPNVMKWLRIPLLNPKSSSHFEKLCHKIVEQRKSSNIEKKDILDGLIRAGEECSLMTPDMMFKTMIQFFTDGFDTFSRLSAVTLYLITAHPEVQDRLVEEMDTVLGDRDEVTEEDTRNLQYLDQVISETMRMCPVFHTFRECGSPYKVPGTDYVIPSGTRVVIPISGLHYDAELWGDPEVFRPERFSPENRGNIPSGAFQPFGLGPRNCLAPNLMRMEMKVLLCHLLRNFWISPRGECGLPLKFHKTEFFLLEGGVNVNITTRN